MAEDNAAQAVPAVEEEVVIDLSKPLEKVEQPNKAAVDAKVAGEMRMGRAHFEVGVVDKAVVCVGWI